MSGDLRVSTERHKRSGGVSLCEHLSGFFQCNISMHPYFHIIACVARLRYLNPPNAAGRFIPAGAGIRLLALPVAASARLRPLRRKRSTP